MLDIHAIETAWVLNSTTEITRNSSRGRAFNNTNGCDSTAYFNNSNLKLYAQILISIFCCAMIIPAVFGNILAIYTFCKTPRLRRYNNYYLVSLAFLDLVGGLIIMPVYGTYWVMGYWPFGRLACEVYKFINHIFTHATFLSVLVIAVDRRRALRHPFRHLQDQTVKHAMKMISATYIIPLIIWSPLKLIQNFTDMIEYVCYENQCLPFYSNKIGLVITVSLFSFLPMFITTIIYIEVSRIARKARLRTYCSQTKKQEKTTFRGRLYRRPSRSFPEQHINEPESSLSTKQDANLCSPKSPPKSRSFKRSFSTGVELTHSTFINPVFEDDSNISIEHANKTNRRLTRYFSADNLFNRPRKLSHQDKHVSFTSIKNESSRATKTLTLTYFAMILSGLPWTITSMVSQFCKPCIPYYVTQVSMRFN